MTPEKIKYIHSIIKCLTSKNKLRVLYFIRDYKNCSPKTIATQLKITLPLLTNILHEFESKNIIYIRIDKRKNYQDYKRIQLTSLGMNVFQFLKQIEFFFVK